MESPEFNLVRLSDLLLKTRPEQMQNFKLSLPCILDQQNAGTLVTSGNEEEYKKGFNKNGDGEENCGRIPHLMSNTITEMSKRFFQNKTDYSSDDETSIREYYDKYGFFESTTEDSSKDCGGQVKNTRLSKFNTHLSSRTTILGSKPSALDVLAFQQLAPLVRGWSNLQRTGLDDNGEGMHHLVRFVDHVQKSDIYGPLELTEDQRVAIDVDHVCELVKPISHVAVKEKIKSRVGPNGLDATKEGDEDLTQKLAKMEIGSGNKTTDQVSTKKSREKKEKKEKKGPSGPSGAGSISPSQIDLRVGHVLRATTHENADSLFVSTIACGDEAGASNTSFDESTGKTVRTVCSGLNGLVPLEEMQNRLVIVVCNLKPVTMRGVKSAAMVLAASPREHEGQDTQPTSRVVELVRPPPNTKPGDRVCFDGWAEGEPEPVLNPKKKIWETVQPGFITTQDGKVGYDSAIVEVLETKQVGLLRVIAGEGKGGICTVERVKGGVVR